MKGIKRTKRSGFTLVELLIVIIIIGILAGAMMMLMGSSSDRAEATKIISNLRSLKAASLQFRADNPNDNDLTIDKLKPFMDGEIGAGYQALSGIVSADVRWGVAYAGTLMANAGVRKALANSAADSSLLGNVALTAGLATTPPYGSVDPDPIVWMNAR